MDEAKFHMVGLIVEDIESSLEFYRLVGLADPSRVADHHVQFRSDTGVTMFMDDEPTNWDPSFTRGSYGLLLEFYLGSEQAVRAKADELGRNGFPALREPYETPYGMCFAMFRDPDGNTVLLSGEVEKDS